MPHQTKLDIVNIALGRLGQEVLNDFDEPNSTGRTVRRFWDGARMEVLRSHAWNFAIRRAILPKVATAPAFGYSTAFTLPGDCLRIVTFNGREIDENQTRFVIEGRQLLTNQDKAHVRYVTDDAPIAEWDPLAQKALAVKLAGDMCMSFKESVTLMSAFIQEYEGLLAKVARQIDANESRGLRRKINYPVDSDLVDQRLRGTSLYTRFLDADPA